MSIDWTRLNETGNEIYIYGAGDYGRQVYRYLWLTKCRSRLKGFIVSSDTIEVNSIYGFPVYAYSYIHDQLNGTSIFLAISENKRGDVFAKLESINGIDLYVIDKEDFINLSSLIYRECRNRKVVNNKVFFSCFRGRGYSCNCKYISEYLIKTQRDIDYIWELDSSNYNNKPHNLPHKIRTVETFSPQHYLEFYTSRVIICNSGLDGIMMPREDQYTIDTWHGTGPLKKNGIDVHGDKDNPEYVMHMESLYKSVDLMIAASDFCVEKYRGAFLYKGEIMKCGFPRNDVFWRDNASEIIYNTRKRIGMPSKAMMVLYAPTYRFEQWQGGSITEMKQQYEFSWERIKESLENRFMREAKLVYRFHHVTDRGLQIHDLYQDGIDATDYSDMQELLLAADILITDYSSSMWDFSLTRKPVFLYFNDKEECDKEIGFYRDPDTYPYPKGHTTEELCQSIRTFDSEKYQRDLNEWFKTYGTYDDGHASECVAERIIDVMDYPEKYGK